MKMAIVLTAIAMGGTLGLASAPANAIVYCKTVGVPRGCVVRPAPVVVAPVVRAPVVVAPVVVAPVVRGPVVAPVRRGVTPRSPVNRGGPVNRVGRR